MVSYCEIRLKCLGWDWHYNFLLRISPMPKIRPKEQDQDYTGPERQTYRRYAPKTKERLREMVEDLGRTTSSAAKFLKVKSSTAKMMVQKWKKMRENNEQVKLEVKQEEKEIQIKVEAQSENQDSSKEGESGQEIQYYIVWFFFFFDFEEKDAEPEKKHDS